jgi:hypothetical protein
MKPAMIWIPTAASGVFRAPTASAEHFVSKNPFELKPDRRLDRVPRRPRIGATALVRDAV